MKRLYRHVCINILQPAIKAGWISFVKGQQFSGYFFFVLKYLLQKTQQNSLHISALVSKKGLDYVKDKRTLLHY